MYKNNKIIIEPERIDFACLVAYALAEMCSDLDVDFWWLGAMKECREAALEYQFQKDKEGNYSTDDAFSCANKYASEILNKNIDKYRI